MTKVKGFPPRKIKAIFDDTSIDVTFEAPQSFTDNSGWVKIWEVADVYVHLKGEEHKVRDNQVAEFKNVITLEVSFPENILNDPYFRKKPKKEQKLYLIYFDKNEDDGNGKWVEFITDPDNPTADPVPFNVSAGKAVVKLKKWIKDPPVGWGGNDPF